MSQDRHYTGECVVDAISSSNVVIGSLRTAEPEFDHAVVSRTQEGRVEFSCSSAPTNVASFFDTLRRCPFCRKHKPLKG
jgi:hypothetical protein